MTENSKTTRQWFREYMAQRRAASRDGLDRIWLTNTCRKLVWIMRGVPVSEWKA